MYSSLLFDRPPTETPVGCFLIDKGQRMHPLQPLRGSIWRVRLSHRLGREFGGDDQENEHPCLVISAQSANIRDRVTILPITTYKINKEYRLLPWGVTIQCSDGDADRGDYSSADVDMVSLNASYE